MNRKDDYFRILVVDDNREVRSIVEEYLGGTGNLVEGASDGREALDKCKTDTYDLIVTDLNMPELSGIELIQEVKKQNNMTEFVIITGYASLDTAVKAIKVGAFDYIVKPFRVEELDVVVKNIKDKIILKKININLFGKLKTFYEEIERYKEHTESASSVESFEETKGSESDTERIVAAIKNMESLTKGPLMIG